MSDKLILRGSEDTPEINFDRSENVFSISGRSYPENPREFYKPVVDWLTNYSESPNPSTMLVVDLEYVNSGSVKEVFKMLYLVEDIMESGVEASIRWCYRNGDELMQQKGMEFKKFLQVPVELEER
ncbi:MAG: DUF1987 domain-containing protein [Crocinitomicaceae bacterium]|nr:DUF1987 domain-containing protein [Crocinitomicaceae bacterium]